MSKVAAAPDSPVMTVRVAARLAEQRGESMAQLPTTGLRAIADAFTGAVEALEDVVAAFDNYGQPERPESWERNLSYAIEDARAALAKALGEA